MSTTTNATIIVCTPNEFLDRLEEKMKADPQIADWRLLQVVPTTAYESMRNKYAHYVRFIKLSV